MMGRGGGGFFRTLGMWMKGTRIISLIVLFSLFLSGTAAAAGDPGLWVFAPTEYGKPIQLADSTWQDVPYNDYVILSIFCDIQEESDLKITFAADASGEIDVRILVDGETAMPDMVQFCQDSSAWSSYSFTFVKTGVSPGYHDVKVQMRSNPSSPGVVSLLDARSLTVLAVPTGGLGYACYDPGTGTFDMITTASWVDIPGASCDVFTKDASDLEISFSAESWNENSNDMVMVRALVDNVLAGPTNVALVKGQEAESHSFTFTRTGLAEGWHTVKMQWSASVGPGYMTGRSLTAFPSRPGDGLWMASPPEGAWLETTSPAWIDLNGLTTTIQVHEPTTLEAVVSGEAIYVPDLQVLIDSSHLEPANTIFANCPWKGATRFSFTKTIDPGIHTVRVQWHTWNGAKASFADRTLVVIAPQSPATCLKGVFRPPAGDNWILDRRMDGITDFRDHYGSTSDRPVVGDLNNDDRVDRAMFRSGEWIVDYHMDGSIDQRDQFGMAGDIPLVGDFNNGGLIDRGVFRNGEWILDYAWDGTVDSRSLYGMAGDIPLVGDYNNDGNLDRAVFRRGEWIVDYGMDGTINSRSSYGMAGDIPLIGDFNDDGYMDRAVFRNGEWIIDYSIDGSINSRQRFGMTGDIPTVWNLPDPGGSILVPPPGAGDSAWN